MSVWHHLDLRSSAVTSVWTSPRYFSCKKILKSQEPTSPPQPHSSKGAFEHCITTCQILMVHLHSQITEVFPSLIWYFIIQLNPGLTILSKKSQVTILRTLYKVQPIPNSSRNKDYVMGSNYDPSSAGLSRHSLARDCSSLSITHPNALKGSHTFPTQGPGKNQ